MSGDEDNDGRFPDETPVRTPFPLTDEQAKGDRGAWPWLPGWIITQCGSDEWEVCVQAPGLGRLADGTIPAPGTPDDECIFPVCFRDASEIRVSAKSDVV